MSTLSALRSASSLIDVASLLDTPTRSLIRVLYKVPEAYKYRTFTVPKKAGGDRTIHAPVGKLKAYQRALANILYACDAELQATRGAPLSHAFREGQSIVTNAALHKHRRYVLNLDLEDFFPALTFGRVRGFFIKDRSFALQPGCATILAQIACFQGALPQGSPCSPIISDLVTRILDQRLVRFAKRHRVTYSRYADDITFSTNAKSFPAELATGGTDPLDPWRLSPPLTDKILGSGFKINAAKTRMQVAASRQIVTGLIVNEKVNISQQYWRGVRSMCQSLFKTGTYYKPGSDPAAPNSAITSLRPLRGALGHVYHVKSTSHVRPVAPPNSQKKAPIVFGQTTFEDFYIYDNFVAPERTLVITEGHTDPVYLRNAIRRLAAAHPKLGVNTAHGFEYKVRFFNHENTVSKLLRMGGSDPLKTLAVTYGARLARYDHRPLQHPIIILLDNDGGMAGFTAAMRNTLGLTIDLKTGSTHYHITENLYAVKTPELGPSGHSCIEDLFGDFKAQPLNGKVLELDKQKFDRSKHLSKDEFARKLVAKQSGSITWSGFSPLLARIEAAMDAHYAPIAGKVVAASGP